MSDFSPGNITINGYLFDYSDIGGSLPAGDILNSSFILGFLLSAGPKSGRSYAAS